MGSDYLQTACKHPHGLTIAAIDRPRGLAQVGNINRKEGLWLVKEEMNLTRIARTVFDGITTAPRFGAV